MELANVTHLIVHEGHLFIDDRGALLSPDGGRVACEQNGGRLEVRVLTHVPRVSCGTQGFAQFASRPTLVGSWQPGSWGAPTSTGTAWGVSGSGWGTSTAYGSNSGAASTTVEFGANGKSSYPCTFGHDGGFGMPSTATRGFGVGDVGVDDTNTVVDCASTMYILAPGTMVQKITTTAPRSQLTMKGFLALDLGILINQGSAVFIPCATYNNLLVQTFGGTLGVIDATQTASVKNFNVVVSGGEVSGFCATESAVISVLDSGAVQCGRTSKTVVCRLATGSAQCNVYTAQ